MVVAACKRKPGARERPGATAGLCGSPQVAAAAEAERAAAADSGLL